MIKTLPHTIIKISIILGIVTVAFAVNYIQAAWSAPQNNPPDGNTPAPINAGTEAQVKEGALSVDGLAVFGNMIISGSTIIGSTTLPSSDITLGVDGSIGATSYLYTSDKNLKTNIKTVAGLDTVKQLRGVSFNWKKNGKKSVGLIAQEVEEVFPELVTTTDSGLKYVEYGNLIAPLIEAIKEQQIQINQLQAELDTLK